MLPRIMKPIYTKTSTAAFSEDINIYELAKKVANNTLFHSPELIIYFDGQIDVANNAKNKKEHIVSQIVRHLKLLVTKPKEDPGGEEYEAFNIKGDGLWQFMQLVECNLKTDKQYAVANDQSFKCAIRLPFGIKGLDAWAGPQSNISTARLRSLLLDIDPTKAHADVSFDSLVTKVILPYYPFKTVNRDYQPTRWYQKSMSDTDKIDCPSQRILLALLCNAKAADANLVKKFSSEHLNIHDADGYWIMERFLRTWQMTDVVDDGFGDADADADAFDYLFPLYTPKPVARESGLAGDELEWTWETGDGPSSNQVLFRTIPAGL